MADYIEFVEGDAVTQAETVERYIMAVLAVSWCVVFPGFWVWACEWSF